MIAMVLSWNLQCLLQEPVFSHGASQASVALVRSQHTNRCRFSPLGPTLKVHLTTGGQFLAVFRHKLTAPLSQPHRGPISASLSSWGSQNPKLQGRAQFMHAHEMNLIIKCLLCKWYKGTAGSTALLPAECGEGSPGVVLTLSFCLRCSVLLLPLW